jgi:uncharacterized membrane protein
MTQPKPVSGTQRAIVIWLDKVIYQLSRHWLAVFNLAMFLYVGIPFTAPVLMKANLTGPANMVYAAYSPLCHQFAFRSWFLFGDRPFYEAGDPIWKATGIDPFDVFDRFKAKSFVGNPQMGFKVAYCERDVAIYGAIVLGGLIFGLFRSRGFKVRPANIVLYVLIGVVPIALDGFSQLFSQAPFYWLHLRESTPVLRTLTGSLFGLMNVWLAYPYVEESFAEIKADLQAKLSRVGEIPGGPPPASAA